MVDEFVLAFPYKGRRPGEVVSVDDADVDDLVKAGIGRPQYTDVKLSLGRLPEQVEVPSVTEEPAPKPRRSKKSEASEAESTEDTAS
jgi:hypothetical protein